ncbi:hypothetical protein QYM36_013179 [Artemia franciscana]|uniref:Heme O synthase n=2 Tax=Artemia franciscana TaxID=6661 RepID=A0AA88L663_ARTSF|nr:hypothetical protein QYM36_013179 [Artemia franciscana]
MILANEMKQTQEVILKEETVIIQTSKACKLFFQYLELGKARLTTLVMTSAVAGYFMGPGDLDLKTLLCCSVGTGFMSASSHVFNQLLEVPHDAMMGRTKQRLLVQKSITTQHAVIFGILVGFFGLAMLCMAVNPLTCFLGALTWLLYVAVYTPMKRISILNTWIGSVVGALPTLMGFTALTNKVSLDGALLFAISFSWQFPHFNALSWYLRKDYARAGYKMMSVCNQNLCRSTTLNYACVLPLICLMTCISGLTSKEFFVVSLPVNGVFIFLSYDFFKQPTVTNARKLFKYSLIYLPLIFSLMFVCKGKYSLGFNVFFATEEEI